MNKLILAVSILLSACSHEKSDDFDNGRAVLKVKGKSGESTGIYKDAETGCHYLYIKTGNSGGLAARTGKDGKSHLGCIDNDH